MGTFVCLAAFLLAASATPIEISSGDSFQDPAVHHEQDSELESHTFTNAVDSSFTEEPPSDTDGDLTSDNEADSGLSPSPSEDTNVTSTEQPPSDTDGDLTSDNEADSGLPPTSSEDPNVSSTERLPSDTPSDGTSGNDVNDNPSSPLSHEDASGNSTEPTPETPPSTENVTPPPDDDPNDCNFTDGKRHVYLQCEFRCSGDQMERAPENATCYLNETEATLTLPAVQNRTGKMTGICVNGSCVPLPTEASQSTATDETSPSTSPTRTLTSILPSGAPSNLALITNTSEPKIMD